MSVTQTVEQQNTESQGREAFLCRLDDVRIMPVGQPAAWFSFTRDGDVVVVKPNVPLLDDTSMV